MFPTYHLIRTLGWIDTLREVKKSALAIAVVRCSFPHGHFILNEKQQHINSSTNSSTFEKIKVIGKDGCVF